MPTKLSIRKELAEAYAFLCKSTLRGVAGVATIDSGKPGPTVGISVCTHGNEPSGLMAFWHFHKAQQSRRLVARGKVIFTLNNMLATQAYLDAKTDKARRRARYLKIDMNRLPDKLVGNQYEVQRARELLPIWRLFDVALDVHSTSQEAPPMLIAGDILDMRLIRGFPIDTIISNIQNIQMGNPAISFYGPAKGKKIPVMGVEVGSHENPASHKRSVDCVGALLRNVGVADPVRAKAGHRRYFTYQEYFVAGSVKFRNRSYSFTRVFENFEPLEQAEVLARGKGAAIRMPFDGHVLLAPKTRKPVHIANETAFLAVPVRTLRCAAS
jgi:Succinylglutamate desuccinylase / Aspartoacylase family